MPTPTKPAWYRTFPSGPPTEIQTIMATPAVQAGIARRSQQFVRNWWDHANTAGKHPDTMWAEMGTVLPLNFGQPQEIADPKYSLRVLPRPDVAGHFDNVPFLLRIALDDLDRSPGSDHQGGVWDVDGIREFWGLIDRTSPWSEYLNEWQAQVWNAGNRRPNSAQWDAYAWSCAFTPWGTKGNLNMWAPAVPIAAVTPEMVWDAIYLGKPIPMAYTFSVDRSCSGNGPQAPHVSTPTVSNVVDIEDDRCWVAGGWGGSMVPAMQLETTRALYPVQQMVPDGARLAGQFPPGHIDRVCKANGYKKGEIAYDAARVMCENWQYGGDGHGGIQAQTGGAMIVPLDSSVEGKVGWRWLGFDDKRANPFRGLFADQSMMVCCGQPTSVDANGKEWKREVRAVSTAF